MLKNSFLLKKSLSKKFIQKCPYKTAPNSINAFHCTLTHTYTWTRARARVYISACGEPSERLSHGGLFRKRNILRFSPEKGWWDVRICPEYRIHRNEPRRWWRRDADASRRVPLDLLENLERKRKRERRISRSFQHYGTMQCYFRENRAWVRACVRIHGWGCPSMEISS